MRTNRFDLANRDKRFAHLSSCRSQSTLSRATAGYVRRPSPRAAPLRHAIACFALSGTYVDSSPGRPYPTSAPSQHPVPTGCLRAIRSLRRAEKRDPLEIQERLKHSFHSANARHPACRRYGNAHRSLNHETHDILLGRWQKTLSWQSKKRRSCRFFWSVVRRAANAEEADL